MDQVVRGRAALVAAFRSPRLSRRAVVGNAVLWCLLAVLWAPMMWSMGVPPLGLLWVGIGAFHVFVAVRAIGWMREHEEPEAILAHGEPRTGELLAFYPDEPPWYIRRFEAEAFSVEVQIDRVRRTRWLPRYRTGAFTDPRVRVGIPLQLRVLGKEVAIDWDTTLAALSDDELLVAADG